MLVIIHGYSDNEKSFRKLADALKAARSRSSDVREINLGDYVTLDDHVTYRDLVEALDKAWSGATTGIPLPRDNRSVDVVVHSTGALVVRNWLTEFFTPESNPIRRFVMLAPANFGSQLAHVGSTVRGRAVKGWRGTKLFETGTHILKGLELASPYTVELAQKDLFTTKTWYGTSRILATTLVGNTGYNGVQAIANKPGSDGTVRVSTANLNCARVAVNFVDKPLNPSSDPPMLSKGQSAFAVLDGENHSTIALKGRSKGRDKTLNFIIRALNVTDDTFADWCNELALHTDAVMTTNNADRAKTKYNGFQNTVVVVRDQHGDYVRDYVLELYVNNDATERDKACTRRIQEEVIESIHPYRDNGAYRSFLVNCKKLRDVLRPEDVLDISITASPDIRNRPVGYRTFRTKDIGALSLDETWRAKLFQDNRTLFLEMAILRERSDRVFRFRRHG